jgi:hypothetical protein
LYAFQSARYLVKRDWWQDVGIELYYHPGHEYNLDRMDKGIKESLDYYTKNFGPYQHKLVRIVEFPRYASLRSRIRTPSRIRKRWASSPRSTTRIRKTSTTRSTSPRMKWRTSGGAISWWAATRAAHRAERNAGRVLGADGDEENFGAGKMRRFLHYDLDQYLMGRALERKKELPLAENENQNYIQYRKGSLAMYQLQDIIGETRINAR